MYAFTSIGMIFAITISSVFLIHRKTPVVKSSHLILSFALLLIHILLFCAPLIFLGEFKGELQCTVAVTINGLFLCVIVAIVFAKTLLLISIFKSKRLTSNGVIKKNFQYMWLLFILVCYMCLVTVAVSNSPYGIEHQINKEKLEKVFSCEHIELYWRIYLYLFCYCTFCV